MPICLIVVFLSAISLRSQSSSKVDFARDVQPIFRERCYACHGPAQQIQGLRLDRRRIAIPNRVGANRASIVPGDSETSPVYLKLIGKRGGLQMPPDGALPPEQISLIKRWIDEGADWPDALSGETTPSIPDSHAMQINEAIRIGDRHTYLRLLSEQPGIGNLKGKSGYTPTMVAALYGDAELLKTLLEHGANPNIKNDANATALLYATDDADKTRLLLDHGADPNVKSEDGQTALLIAAWRPGSLPVMKLLLDHGATLPVRTPGAGTIVSPLNIAATSGNDEVIQLLLDRGIDKTPLPLGQAMRSGCAACSDILLKYADTAAMSDALGPAVAGGDVVRMRMLLEHGARPGPDVLPSLTLLSQTVPSDFVDALIRAGADVNARTAIGGTVLDLARLQGDTPLVHALMNAGARSSESPDETPHRPNPAKSVRAAIERTLPLLDRADIAFIDRAGCISCHNNALTPMTRAAVRKARIPVNEDVASSQMKKMVDVLAGNRDRALQALGLAGRGDTAGYVLMALAAAKYPADDITDAWARYLKNLQQKDGRWRVQALRPPLESSDIQGTAAAIRALQVYAPKSQKEEYRMAVQNAARWLETARPLTTEDRAFLVLGLHWAGGNPQVLQLAVSDLLAEQRSDGGWSQLSTLSSDAYATGQALVALGESGLMKATSIPYQRGVRFLLNSQMEDGSWFVRTRTLPAQPLFNSDFPFGPNQFISAAATNWATMALAFGTSSNK
jgi:ankyrin repeat protein